MGHQITSQCPWLQLLKLKLTPGQYQRHSAELSIYPQVVSKHQTLLGSFKLSCLLNSNVDLSYPQPRCRPSCFFKVYFVCGKLYLTRASREDSAVGPWRLKGGEIEPFHLFNTQYPGHLLLIRDQVIGQEHNSVGISSRRFELFCCVFSWHRTW